MYEGRTAAEPGITFGKIRVKVWSDSSAKSIKGHENMGIVEELGEGVISLKKGDRVVMPFNVADGRCRNCEEGKTAFCTGVNPGFAGGAYGELCIIQRCGLSFFWLTSHRLRRYGALSWRYAFSGSLRNGNYINLIECEGQAQYIRVPFADFNALKLPPGKEHEADFVLLAGKTSTPLYYNKF